MAEAEVRLYGGAACRRASTNSRSRRFAEEELLAMNMSHRYASLAALEAWQDAGLERPARDTDEVDWDTGAILGTGIGGMDTIGEKVCR